MTVLEAEVVIDAPGVYDIPADEYHADPVPGGSLSSHGARELLACPARYRYMQDHHETAHTDAKDEGTAAHLAVLGAGDRVVRVDADDWRTKGAKDARKDAYATGKTPILERRWQAIQTGMVAAIRNHRLASALLTGGRPEQTLIWRDDATGVMCRAMVDYLHPARLVDYKTVAGTVDPISIDRAVRDYGHHVQQVHYQDGAQALGLGELPFYFVFQERTAPHLVTVAQLPTEYVTDGRAKVRRAREIYRDCTAAGVWPSYLPDTDIAHINPPRWFQPEEYPS